MKSNMTRMIDAADRKAHEAAKRARTAKRPGTRSANEVTAAYFKGYGAGVEAVLAAFEK